MSFADQYLFKHKPFISPIKEPPSGLLSFIVVIPLYLEDNILDTLESIKNSQLPQGSSEILIIVNYPDNDSEDHKIINQKTFNDLLVWAKKNSIVNRKYFPMLAVDLPVKHAGAGLARKIGMDEAVRRFNQLNKPDGLILSLDADTMIEENYFQAIEYKMYHQRTEKCGGCIINFEHPTGGARFNNEVYNAILQYELHLRYYKYALKYTGFPFYEYTIGSCFGISAETYARHGGMNRQKGGEDFYFLHKIFPHKTFAFISDTCVYPSPRISERVPFGTGPVIKAMIDNQQKEFFTYSPHAFFELRVLFGRILSYYRANKALLIEELNSLPASISEFLISRGFQDKLEEINRNSASPESFVKRFYGWFDGFMVVKYLNYSHQEHFKKLPVCEAVVVFLERTEKLIFKADPRLLLTELRSRDKKG